MLFRSERANSDIVEHNERGLGQRKNEPDGKIITSRGRIRKPTQKILELGKEENSTEDDSSVEDSVNESKQDGDNHEKKLSNGFNNKLPPRSSRTDRSKRTDYLALNGMKRRRGSDLDQSVNSNNDLNSIL